MLTDEQAIDIIIAEETGGRPNGGLNDRGDDTGGITKWGITIPAWTDYMRAATGNLRATANHEDIRALSSSDARAFYAWKQKSVLWRIPYPDLRYVMLDAIVNMGDGPGIKLLQRAVGVEDDGVLGPITAAQLMNRDPGRLCRLVCIEQMLHYAHLARHDLKDRDQDGVPDRLESLEGWDNRLAKKMRRFV